VHGAIPKEQLKHFFTSLMDSRETERLIMAIDPRQFPATDSVQTAIVSLQDAVAMFQAVRYALVEAEAHLTFYGKDVEDNPTPAAAFYAQYYVDDAYLRLPRAADLVANTLVFYLEIEPKEIEPALKTPGGLSQALAHYLARRLEQSTIARAFQRLYDSDDWRFVVTHRDAWLRGQCIRLHGSGIAHSRQIGWDVLEGHAMDRAAREFGSLMVNPVVRRSQLEYGLPVLFARAKGGYNAMVTLLHTVYEELARSAKTK
jgi:hypothetical protein